MRAEKSFLNEKFGVVDIGLFGSFAIGQPNRDSDIDLFVALKEPRFDWIAGLQVYLENKFNRKIGLS
ncbi:MAG: nucleotidyltransferase domain-containing protein [Pseudomonadota bacterium]